MKEIDPPKKSSPANTYVHPAYQVHMNNLRRIHTNAESDYLTFDEEQRLTAMIQEDRQQIEQRKEVQVAYKNAQNYEERMVIGLRLLSPEAKAAFDKLVESNLLYAAFLARASMNIVPQAEIDELTGEKKSARWKVLGTFSDITNLRSQRAVLADRVQVANMGLMEAAWKYTPGVVGQRGKRASFLGFAKWHIHNRINRYVTGSGETPAIEIPRHVKEAVNKAINNWSDLDPQQRLEIIQLRRLENPVALEDVEQYGQEEDNLETIAYKELRDSIKVTLATLSEREGLVIRMRFGLGDGLPRTFDEIGAVIGVTRERARQIETKAMSRLRHASRSYRLASYLHEENDKPVYVTDQQQRTMKDSRQRWQAASNEAQDTPEQRAIRFRKEVTLLAETIDKKAVYSFRQPKPGEPRSLYPEGLFRYIKNEMGEYLTANHVATVWNRGILPLAERAYAKLGQEFSLDRCSQLFSRLLAEYMQDGDEVGLEVPESLDGRLNYVGAWVQRGQLRVNGNVGNYAGMSIGDAAQLTFYGNAGSHSGYGAYGNSATMIYGSAGDFAGCAMRGNAQLEVAGSVGDYCGYALSSKGAGVTVGGDAGEHVGYRGRYGTILVKGFADSITRSSDFTGVIQVGGVGKRW